MSKNVVIKAENISKQYRLGMVGTGTLSHDLKRWWALARGKEDPYLKIGSENDRTKKADSDYAWALQDINFEVKQGDTLGIIGRNGAGKSTLLKLLSRVTSPTTGTIKTRGRIASLLEVGTGFHPELSGRENIYLNGAILGMSKKEIASKFDEILDFSGVEMYVDTPVKRYSSGMYVRLAFAVAAFLEPEILIVDEVLAVGDAEFQKKCLGRMKDVSVNDGRTVLFVSHNMTAIQSLCSQSLMLQNGKVSMIGDTFSVIDHYLKNYSQITSKKEWSLEDAPGNNVAKIIKAEIVNGSGETIENSYLEEEVFLNITYQCLEEGARLNLSVSVITEREEVVFASPSITDTVWSGAPHPKGRYVSQCAFPADFFNEILYKVNILVVKNGREIVALAEDAVFIQKVDSGLKRGTFFGTWSGITRPILDWKTERC